MVLDKALALKQIAALQISLRIFALRYSRSRIPENLVPGSLIFSPGMGMRLRDEHIQGYFYSAVKQSVFLRQQCFLS